MGENAAIPIRKRIVRLHDLTVTQSERAITFVISTDDLARDKGILLSGKCRTQAYNDNPIFIWSHLREIPAVASGMWPVKKDPKRNPIRLIEKYRFSDKTQWARDLYGLYSDGTLKCVSVSWDPLDQSPPTPDELRKNPDWADAHWIGRDWELEEVSGCNVPALKQAMTMTMEADELEHSILGAVSKGRITSEFARSFMGVEIPVIEKETEPEREQLSDVSTVDIEENEPPPIESVTKEDDTVPDKEPEQEQESPMQSETQPETQSAPVIEVKRAELPIGRRALANELTRAEIAVEIDRRVRQSISEIIGEKVALLAARITGRPIK